MKIEMIQTIPLDKKQAKIFAVKIAQEQLSQTVKKVKYLGGGSFGQAFGIMLANGKELVIKFLKAPDMMKKEVQDLKLLASNCSISIPKIIFERQADDIIPADCYAMEKIGGKSAFSAFGMLFACKRKRQDFADSVTTALHEIHNCVNDKFGDTLSPNFSSWIDCYKPFAQAVLDKAEEMFSSNQISEKIIMTMRQAWKKFDIVFSEKVQQACLTHGDLNMANIMVDKRYRLNGFIDPLNSMYADREYDLFQFDNLTGKRFFLRKTYIRKYGSSKYCDAKCAFYGLWNEVYCYIKSGILINIIMNPLLKNMRKVLASL